MRGMEMVYSTQHVHSPGTSDSRAKALGFEHSKLALI
jgi:hypothetical protein